MTEILGLPVLAETPKKSVHVCAGTADHGQSAAALMLTVCVPPAAGTLSAEGVTVYAHLPASTAAFISGHQTLAAERNHPLETRNVGITPGIAARGQLGNDLNQAGDTFGRIGHGDNVERLLRAHCDGERSAGIECRF